MELEKSCENTHYFDTCWDLQSEVAFL